MKFPITRETLQTFDYSKEQQELMEEEIQKQLTLFLDLLCNVFRQEMQLNSIRKKFTWSLTHSIWIMNQEHRNPLLPDTIPLFIDKLKEVFIGCDISTDPLKTFLMIDWS